MILTPYLLPTSKEVRGQTSGGSRSSSTGGGQNLLLIYRRKSEPASHRRRSEPAPHRRRSEPQEEPHPQVRDLVEDGKKMEEEEVKIKDEEGR